MGMMTPTDIKAIRVALGLEHEEFAARLGVSANTVYRWELGDRHPNYGRQAKLNVLAAEARRAGKLRGKLTGV